MKTALVLVAFVALASAFGPDALKPVLKLTREQRATSAWAVLVAGSNSYSNYRHQSDICQMYQTLKKLGVPEERMIVMMYDDIAKNSQNPRKGVIINTPDGENVYEGVPKDYTGKLVTSSNFLTILAGGVPAGGSGKKLGSGKNDHVFIFFSDHGGSGILCFPSDNLGQKKLESGLQTMYEKGLYGELVFNVEACEAGSMFYKTKLPPNAYVHTASPVSESSYAWQWDDTVNAYVSDVWSWYAVHYMEDHPENTMQELFDSVYESMSNYSLPCQYGELSITGETTAEYFGMDSGSRSVVRKLPKGVVKAYNVTLNVALKMYEKYPSAETKATLEKELAIHAAVDKLTAKIASTVGFNGPINPSGSCTATLRESSCVELMSEAFRESCTHNHEYFGRTYELFNAICARVPSNRLTNVLSTIKSECSAAVASL